ncbi:MAG: iron-containing alcohol dehydrogenase [Sedimentisphaerales bacterium]|nr:iron-containing alcohol dehydrogenase [Sedimentisphaerales bacterium]
MENFTYCNPTKIIFGKNTIAQLDELIEPEAKILFLYGFGSIKKNGVYQQAMKALKNRKVIEFANIEPNPTYETCIKAIELGRKEKIDFILAVGGGSVLDASKFIAAGIKYKDDDLWQIVTSRGSVVTSAIPIGTVLTLPATGSEMNRWSVMSKSSTKEKLSFGSEHTYPKFSILDPETTYSLDKKQIRNGIVDTFVHAVEQYATIDLNTPLQDRYAISILQTLVELAPSLMSDKKDYDAYASFMWTATQAQNGLLGCGVRLDWSTHGIGHELTAFFGLAHAETLAIVLPALWKYELDNKCKKLAKIARQVFNVTEGDEKQQANTAIMKTSAFFNSIQMPTTLAHYNIKKADIQQVVDRFAERGSSIGENQDIDAKAVEKILKMCL